jgi:pantetheine-phosphate adenylyltransferase
MASRLSSADTQSENRHQSRKSIIFAARNFCFEIAAFTLDPINPMRLAIYPGSFDPITNGHVDVIARAAALFDEVLVAVAVNDAKMALFSTDERVRMIEEVIAHIPNAKVTSFEGLLMEFARQNSATAVVRGLRAISDFEFEFQMALMNRKLEPTIETVFLTPREEYTYLSSRIVKEIARLGGPVDAFVPGPVVEGLRKKLSVGA